MIWNGLQSITGRNYKHVRFLVEHDLNLYASHLPLDMHDEYGNSIELAKALKLQDIEPFGDYHGVVVGYRGVLEQPTQLNDVANVLSNRLGGKPLIVRNGRDSVRSIGIVSGGGGGMIEQAATAKLDCYVTGEPIHFGYQLSREVGSNVIYLGHYHSEKLGVQAIGRLLEEELSVENVFLEIGAFTAADYTD